MDAEMTELRETVEKILSPALDPRAPYAKHMIDAIVELVTKKTTRIGASVTVGMNYKDKIVSINTGEELICMPTSETRKLAGMLNQAADLVDAQVS